MSDQHCATLSIYSVTKNIIIRVTKKWVYYFLKLINASHISKNYVKETLLRFSKEGSLETVFTVGFFHYNAPHPRPLHPSPRQSYLIFMLSEVAMNAPFHFITSFATLSLKLQCTMKSKHSKSTQTNCCSHPYDCLQNIPADNFVKRLLHFKKKNLKSGKEI